jgi:hypothetical protein
MRSQLRAMALLLALLPGAARAAETVAVFDPELVDTSGEGRREDQQRRLALIGEDLRRALADSGRYAVVDPAPLRAKLAEGPALNACQTCSTEAAQALGADLALVTVVHKVSNLIMSITLALREAAPSGATRAVYSAEIRGNTDESWQHGMRWLLRNRLLAAPDPARR